MKATTFEIIRRACESQLQMPTPSLNDAARRQSLAMHVGYAYEAFIWGDDDDGWRSRHQAAVRTELEALGFVW